MHISKSAGYAVHGLVYVATKGQDKPVQISEIAEFQDVSRTYLAKIFQQLSVASLIIGQRGIAGGYYLARDPSEITMLDIVEAVDGPVIKRHCCLGLIDCKLKPNCAVLDAFMDANEQFAASLRKVTLAEVIEKHKRLKAPYIYKSRR
ncbi:MAG: Rrf2 family transcriptional regulator [Bacteroidota bacterium]|nr:Rrf2 family transcriptional regulator [Bacteroidota bacterium]